MHIFAPHNMQCIFGLLAIKGGPESSFYFSFIPSSIFRIKLSCSYKCQLGVTAKKCFYFALQNPAQRNLSSSWALRKESKMRDLGILYNFLEKEERVLVENHCAKFSSYPCPIHTINLIPTLRKKREIIISTRFSNFSILPWDLWNKVEFQEPLFFLVYFFVFNFLPF